MRSFSLFRGASMPAICILLFVSYGVSVALAQVNDQVVEPSNKAMPMVVDFADLAPETKRELEASVSKAVAAVVDTVWRKLGITDAIAVELFSVLHRFVENHDAVVSVCLIGPAAQLPRNQNIELKQDGKLLMQYTSFVAKVPQPLAVINEIDSNGKRLSIRNTLLYHDDKTGWKALRHVPVSGE